ncbi:NTE family protein [Rhodoferax sp. OV413]|uniref:patatin-like phospholipase family protein n=1 Tax=Rhodoferax sp. OV413 TaxID=1855285 RepID=UPI000891393C|nr:patatin-like phospholipase family protein [Rhodoferax sp. OV413]SDO15533.1 NTE family protein [Rhodoferax sp. OV413]
MTQQTTRYFFNPFQAGRGLGWRAGGLLAVAVFLAGCATAPVEVNQPPTVNPPVAKRLPRIGLALGGGAARGFAHVGVLQVLEEAGIRPDLVVGTSAGSLVASLYASGKTGAQMQLVAETMEEAAFTDWTLPIFSRGMLRGDALARYVNAQVANRPIEAMPLPLGIVATDLNSGEAVLFQRGDTGTAVRASSAVPAVFQPVKIGTHEYVDGGLVSPVPVRFAHQMGAELVIAVDISSAPEGNLANDTLQILLQTFAIMGKSINTYELRDADVVVRPSLLGIKSADFAARRRSILAGRAAMLQLLPQLQAALLAKSR